MRIVNRTHLPWLVFTLAATAAAVVLYLANFHPQSLPFAFELPAIFGATPPSRGHVGGTPLGVLYGAISLAIFLFAALLGLRKKIPLWRVGRVQLWLRAHIWLTLLTIPLVALHSGFRLGGAMTTLLLLLYAFVMASGIYGLILQHHLPRLMKERLPAETVYEQIPHIRAQLCAAAEKMRDSFRPAPATEKKTAPAPMAAATPTVTTPTARAKSASDSALTAATVTAPPPKPAPAPGDPESEKVLADFIERQILPYLRARNGRRLRLGERRYSDELFRFLKLRIALGYRPRADEIEAWCDERRLLDAQTRMHHWLHGWLFVHVPFSFVLILVTIWHAYVALFRF